MTAAARLGPWVALIVWWLALARFRRNRPWLRSAVLAVGLVIATLFADASVVVASTRMTEPGGHAFATLVLWIAAFFSITTYAILRAPSGSEGDDGSGDGGSKVPRPPPEPPWWPNFERDFRDYTRRVRRPPPRTPVGQR